MARCWTCGTHTEHPVFVCPTCRTVDEIQKLRERTTSDLRNLRDKETTNLALLAEVQRRGFEALSDRLSEIATVIEWGFEELSWQLQQQTEVLKSIDHTLKTPSQTQANEWRQIAEELRCRDVLDESEEFFLKSLRANPLDYRTYIGLAETYLQMEKFDEAKTFLEKSLPHAPIMGLEESKYRREKKEEEMSEEELLDYYEYLVESEEEHEELDKRIEEMSDEEFESLLEEEEGIKEPRRKQVSRQFDYKSYSYRLIGHIYAGKEEYHHAVSSLRSAIELSPTYYEAIYDYAQYCAK